MHAATAVARATTPQATAEEAGYLGTGRAISGRPVCIGTLEVKVRQPLSTCTPPGSMGRSQANWPDPRLWHV